MLTTHFTTTAFLFSLSLNYCKQSVLEFWKLLKSIKTTTCHMPFPTTTTKEEKKTITNNLIICTVSSVGSYSNLKWMMFSFFKKKTHSFCMHTEKVSFEWAVQCTQSFVDCQ